MTTRSRRYTDEQVKAMLSSGNWSWFSEQIRMAAKERGCDLPSVVLLTVVVEWLRNHIGC